MWLPYIIVGQSFCTTMFFSFLPDGKGNPVKVQHDEDKTYTNIIMYIGDNIWQSTYIGENETWMFAYIFSSATRDSTFEVNFR